MNKREIEDVQAGLMLRIEIVNQHLIKLSDNLMSTREDSNTSKLAYILKQIENILKESTPVPREA